MRRFDDFKLGVFILVGVGIAAAAVIWVGFSGLFTKSKTYVTYFDSSVRGLRKDTAVDYLGLSVGRISGMSLMTDKHLVQVMLKMDRSFDVRKWMAIQKKFGGITGGDYLALVEAPKDLEKITPKIDFQTKYPVIPSVPGQFAKVIDSLEKIAGQAGSLNLGKLVGQYEQVAANANELLKSKQIQESLDHIRDAAARIDGLTAAIAGGRKTDQWQRAVDDITSAAESVRLASRALESQLAAVPPGRVADISRQADEAVRSIHKSTKSVEEQVGQALTLLEQSMSRLNQTLIQFQDLAQSLRQQPGRILSQPQTEEPFSK